MDIDSIRSSCDSAKSNARLVFTRTRSRVGRSGSVGLPLLTRALVMVGVVFVFLVLCGRAVP
jgi:hypothetical protein